MKTIKVNQTIPRILTVLFFMWCLVAFILACNGEEDSGKAGGGNGNAGVAYTLYGRPIKFYTSEFEGAHEAIFKRSPGPTQAGDF